MKNKVAFLLLIILFPLFRLYSQNLSIPDFYTRQKNVYFGLLGSNFMGGVNFDMRFNKGQHDGLGFRIGAGMLTAPSIRRDRSVSVGIIPFPMEINRVWGKKRNGLIAGLGVIPVYATVAARNNFDSDVLVLDEGPNFMGGYMTLGYRRLPISTGFMFQVSWNPMLLRGLGFLPGWVSVGVGLGIK